MGYHDAVILEEAFSRSGLLTSDLPSSKNLKAQQCLMVVMFYAPGACHIGLSLLNAFLEAEGTVPATSVHAC